MRNKQVRKTGQKDLIRVAPQVVEDKVSGLTLVFSSWEGSGHLTVSGNIPYGNREFFFDEFGELDGMGCYVGPPRTTDLADSGDVLPN
jgi:hypothetical protein